jgi:tetratricopeptide (TPR) repeat protein
MREHVAGGHVEEFIPETRQSTLRRAGLTLLFLLSVSAHAEGESGVRAYLLSVNRLYQDLEYERAMAQIARARSLGPTVAEDVTLSLYEGIILADMNRWEESAGAFKEALFIQPEAKLPVKVSPKVEQSFEKVRQAVKQELAVHKQAPAPPPSPPSSPRLEPPAQAAASPQRAAPPGSAQAPTGEQISPTPDVSSVQAQRAPSGRLQPKVLAPAIGGGVLMVLGGTSWAFSRRELARLKGNDSSLDTREEVRSSASRGRTYQAAGLGMLGAGLAGLGIAAGLHFLGSPSKEMALGVSTNGTSAFVHGRWP